MKITTLIISLFAVCVFAFSGCGNEGNESDTDMVADSVEVVESAMDPKFDLILGKWKLVEMRIQGLDPILQESFSIFEENGILTLSDPSDPDLEDLSIPFFFRDGILSYDEAEYEVKLLLADSMVLTNTVDGESVTNIYVRAD